MYSPLSVISSVTVPASPDIRLLRVSCNGEAIFTNTYHLSDEFNVYGIDDVVRQYMLDNSLVSASVTIEIKGGDDSVISHDVICTDRRFAGGSEWFGSSFLIDCNYLEIPFIDFGDATPGVGVATNKPGTCSISTYTADAVVNRAVDVPAGVSVISVPVPETLPAMVAIIYDGRTAYMSFLPAISSYNRVILRWKNSFNVPVVDSFPAKITENPPKMENPVSVGNTLRGIGIAEAEDFTLEISEITFDRAKALLKLAESPEVELLTLDPVRFSTDMIDVPLTYKSRRIVIKNIDGNISDSRTEMPSLSITFEYADNTYS